MLVRLLEAETVDGHLALLLIAILVAAILVAGPLAAGMETSPSGAPNAMFTPPPRPPPVPTKGDSYDGHYWLGSAYAGIPTTARSLQVNLTVPHDLPDRQDFYYVLLSVWDDAGAYDQIGYSADYGVWGLTWAALTGCGSHGRFDANAMKLTPGVRYTFTMTIAAGVVTFVASTTTVVWSKSLKTGGTTFEVANTFACGGGSYYDYTNYEEVYVLDNAMTVPQWDFFFTDNVAGNEPVADWMTFNYFAPEQASVLLNEADVTVANEWFSLVLPFPDSFIGPDSGTITELGSVLGLFVSPACLSYGGMYCQTTIDVVAAPSGWTVSTSVPSGTPDFGFSVGITASTGTEAGRYAVVLEAREPGGAYTTFAVYVDVLGDL